jgi:hypothetical protein
VTAADDQHPYNQGSDESDALSPSAEAAKLAITNGNGFNDVAQPLGWFNHMRRPCEKSPAQTRKGQLYENLGAAAAAAFDNAAE